MTLDDFMALSHENQQEKLWFRGAILANRYEQTHIFLLYALDNFFVELEYDSQSNRLERINAFRSTDHLLPYLPLLPDDLLEEQR